MIKIDAVGVTTSNMELTIQFYKLLGFTFPEDWQANDHVEAITPTGSARLMIDPVDVVEEIINEKPKPGNHSLFAVHFDNPEAINTTCKELEANGFKVIKQPWDAPWGQHYAIVEDPDGYKVDLYAQL